MAQQKLSLCGGVLPTGRERERETEIVVHPYMPTKNPSEVFDTHYLLKNSGNWRRVALDLKTTVAYVLRCRVFEGHSGIDMFTGVI